MNPIWQKVIYDAVKNAIRVCPHCKKSAAYALKPAGRFYKCKHCGHKFKEKGQ
jgi:DNA-directed RNA polymerase subunit M/transcription elongation factor TFIIS